MGKPAFQPGGEIGAYRILDKLGEGGMGTVYLAEHTLLGRRAAIKVLRREFTANEELVQRFFNEARAVTQIADPGIVQVFDFGQGDDGGAYIVMEALEGEPLDRRLARLGPLPVAEALHLTQLVARSLAAAHAKGIVHRDLKPENIFVVGDPAVTHGVRPKILDFGIAKLSGEEGTTKTQTGVLMGTPVYMSPEQCKGSHAVDARADIYQLGGVLVTMLTGKPPFLAQSSGELIVAHLQEPPPVVSERRAGVGRAIDRLVQTCMAKEADDRYPSMLVLAQAIGEAARGSGGSEHGRSRRGIVIGASAAVVVAIGAIVTAVAMRGGDEPVTPAPLPPPPVPAAIAAPPIDAAPAQRTIVVDAPVDAAMPDAAPIKKKPLPPNIRKPVVIDRGD